MKIPDSVYISLRDKLWAVADHIGWVSLTDQQKSAYYEEWLKDAKVGEVLGRYLDHGSVRVYLKDTIMKPYTRERIKDAGPIMRLVDETDDGFVEDFIKPHGRVLANGHVVCWGLARDWKDIVLAVYERAYGRPSRKAHAVILMYPTGKLLEAGTQRMIEDLARRLEITRVVWFQG